MKGNKEYLVCSAVYYDTGKKCDNQPRNIETGIVVCGLRHHNCFATFLSMIMAIEDINREEAIERLKVIVPRTKKVQGFLTNKNNFYDRKESLVIARKAGQVDKIIAGVLTSEDLW